MSGALSLKARFPYMFSGLHAGLTFYRGWTPALVRACERIDAVLPPGKYGFHWVQLSTDQGSGLFFYVLDDRRIPVVDIRGDSRRARMIRTDESAAIQVCSRVDSIVFEAERMTGSSCMVCGHRGGLSFQFGQALTVCGAHPPEALNSWGEEGLEGFWREAIEWEEAPSV